MCELGRDKWHWRLMGAVYEVAFPFAGLLVVALLVLVLGLALYDVLMRL